MNKNKVIYQADSGPINLIKPDFTVEDKVLPGFYKVKTKSAGFMKVLELHLDNSKKVPKTSMELSKHHLDIDYINKYFSKTGVNAHKALNIKLKLGILLFGEQGTGKTTTAYALGDYLINKMNAVIVTVEDSKEYAFAVNFLKEAKTDNDFMSMIIFDECEYAMHHNESEMKRLLDSSSSLDNNISFFTTNYINKIPDAIKNRPSRIKWCKKIEGINEEDIIFSILNRMNGELSDELALTDKQIRDIVPKLKGSTMDEIKNRYVDILINTKTKKVKKSKPEQVMA